MHLIYLSVRIFPYWAIPVAVVFGQLGLHFRRKESPIRFPCWAATGSLILLALAWIVLRGDLHSDEWVRNLF